jgi:hypothetical protein
MVRGDDLQRIALRITTEYKESRVGVVSSVENKNRGYDLLSRKPQPLGTQRTYRDTLR